MLLNSYTTIGENMEKEKLKIAFYWAASCGGCEVAVLDVNEKILDVVAKADIVFWPVAMDIKYKDVEAMPDKSIDACFFNGAIRNSENESMAKLLRKKAKILCFINRFMLSPTIIGQTSCSLRGFPHKGFLQVFSFPSQHLYSPSPSLE